MSGTGSPKSWNNGGKAWRHICRPSFWRTKNFPNSSLISSMSDTCPLYQKQKVVDLLMRQNLKSQASCPTSRCCCSSGIHTSCLQPAIFPMWSSKEFFMEYFILICSPGRSPIWLEEAEASFSVNGKNINSSTNLPETLWHNSSS